MGPLYKGHHVFFTVAQTGQTKHPLSFYDSWRFPQVLCHVWKGRVIWGVSAATCNFSSRCHYIPHTEPLISFWLSWRQSAWWSLTWSLDLSDNRPSDWAEQHRSHLSPFCLFRLPLYSSHLFLSDRSPEMKSCRSGPSSLRGSFFVSVLAGEDLATVVTLLVYTYTGRTRGQFSYVGFTRSLHTHHTLSPTRTHSRYSWVTQHPGQVVFSGPRHRLHLHRGFPRTDHTHTVREVDTRMTGGEVLTCGKHLGLSHRWFVEKRPATQQLCLSSAMTSVSRRMSLETKPDERLVGSGAVFTWRGRVSKKENVLQKHQQQMKSTKLKDNNIKD